MASAGYPINQADTRISSNAALPQYLTAIILLIKGFFWCFLSNLGQNQATDPSELLSI
jgi:hypothetical protein